MTLNYPHEGLVVPKANAVVGSSKPVCEIPTLPDGKLRRGGKIPHVCQKKTKVWVCTKIKPKLQSRSYRFFSLIFLFKKLLIIFSLFLWNLNKVWPLNLTASQL